MCSKKKIGDSFHQFLVVDGNVERGGDGATNTGINFIQI
jgi:hypothetical protein